MPQCSMRMQVAKPKESEGEPKAPAELASSQRHVSSSLAIQSTSSSAAKGHDDGRHLTSVSSTQKRERLPFDVQTTDSLGTITATMLPQPPPAAGADIETKRDFLDGQLDSLRSCTVLGGLSFVPGLNNRLQGGAWHCNSVSDSPASSSQTSC